MQSNFDVELTFSGFKDDEENVAPDRLARCAPDLMNVATDFLMTDHQSRE